MAFNNTINLKWFDISLQVFITKPVVVPVIAKYLRCLRKWLHYASMWVKIRSASISDGHLYAGLRIPARLLRNCISASERLSIWSNKSSSLISTPVEAPFTWSGSQYWPRCYENLYHGNAISRVYITAFYFDNPSEVIRAIDYIQNIFSSELCNCGNHFPNTARVRSMDVRYTNVDTIKATNCQSAST